MKGGSEYVLCPAEEVPSEGEQKAKRPRGAEGDSEVPTSGGVLEEKHER